MSTPTNPLMALAALVMGAGTATAAAPDAAIGEPLTAGIGGLLGYGVHLIGRAVRDWIAADAAARREFAELAKDLRNYNADSRELHGAVLEEVRAIGARIRAHFEVAK
jgi:hypothetical protein